MGSGTTHPKQLASREKFQKEHAEREAKLKNWPGNLKQIQACKSWTELQELLGEEAGKMVFYILLRDVDDNNRRAIVEKGRNCPNHEAAARADAYITQLAIDRLSGKS